MDISRKSRRGVEEKKPNIILVGLSGSGKTTIGRVVARELHWPFIDFDTEIEHRQHSAVHEIFARHGEAYFRGLEEELTRELVTCSGGGKGSGTQTRDVDRRGSIGSTSRRR